MQGENTMKADCHMHMILEGRDYRTAMSAHFDRPRDDLIHRVLSHYQALGFRYLRDGGDRWGVALRARELAGQYGITYTAPAFPIHKEGHYGRFIGRGFSTVREYRALLEEAKTLGGDFVKLMIAGLMDFDCCGKLRGEPLPPGEIKELIHIARGEGFSVMVHGNGAGAVTAAAEAGAGSVEHGAYLNGEALSAMKEAGTVWVPTLATIGQLRGTGRFDERAVREILEGALANVQTFAAMGGLLAPGSDAGAYAVYHGEGGECEYGLLRQALADACDACLDRGTVALTEKFPPLAP